MDEHTQASSRDERPHAGDALREDDIPIGEPLAEPLVDAGGALLLAAGAILPDTAARSFLFTHFSPHRARASDAAPHLAKPDTEPSDTDDATASQSLRAEDLDITVGTRLGMRPQLGMGRAMHPGRLIGMAPNRMLFATLPVVGRDLLPVNPGEQVEIVALSGQAVVWFVCTVEAVCRAPFDYLVFSAPGVIRQLRTRRQIRVRSHLAVRYGVDLTGSHFEGLGLGHDLSVQGMSLAAASVLGRPGERLCVSFGLHMGDADTALQAVAVIRNVYADPANPDLTMHGLEFDPLDPAQQLALKACVLDLQHEALHRGAV
ncbi:flagellar brake protein [Paraburkholderia sp.]|uniref:flagellar brake protein n=1 Tax=Paraburkholderia sp. TaxID=1926495 RepID=UPI003D6E9AF8